MTCCCRDVAVHERGVAPFDAQLRLLLQGYNGARLKLDRLGFLQKVVCRSEVALSESRIGGVDEFGNSVFGLGQFLQPLPHFPEFLGFRHQEGFEFLFRGIRHIASEVTREFLQQAWGKTWHRSRVAGRALFPRDVERDAERIDGPCLWVRDLACLDVRDTCLGQAGFLGETILRQPLDAPLFADEPSEQHSEAVHSRNFR